MSLYVDCEKADGYLRDGCVFKEDIDIADTMNAIVKYSNGATMSYSLNTFMPIEGYRLAFNGTLGRLEVRDYERQPWPAPETEMAVIKNFGKREEMIFLGREIGEQRNYSDEVARMIDDEVRAIIDKAYVRATEVLTTYKDRLTELAEALVAKETIEADEFAAMFADLPDPRSEPGGSPTPKLTAPSPLATPDAPRTESEQPAAPRQAPGASPQPA